MKSPGETLREALRAASLTPLELANAWETSRALVYAVLADKSNMSWDQAVKAAQLCGISLDQLAGKEVSPKDEAVAELLEAIARTLSRKEE